MSLSHGQASKIAGAHAGEGLHVPPQQQAARPVVFAVETDPSCTETLLSAAINSRIRCEIFENSAAVVDGLSRSTPDLILLDVTSEGANAIEVLHALSQCAYPGILQLMSQRGVAMVGPILQLAQLHSLKVLPPLTKPIAEAPLKGVLDDLSSTVSQSKLPQIRLDDAIRNGWVQFWYQPKIDLRAKTLFGVEAFIRLFHPHKGLIPPATILKNSDDLSLIALLHYALVETATAGTKLSELGLKPTIAINANLKALQTLPMTPTFRDHIKKTGRQRNWIFDVSEEDLVKNRPAFKNIGAAFRSVGIKLAIESFSGAVLPLSELKELPISEIKLSPRFVAHCHNKSDHADVCKALIGIAHDLKSAAVAIGIETTAQLQALQRMGCDVGQGFLFGHPLPLEQIVAMVRQRSVRTQLALV
jgi:EAL domain-containing protein (putative c-di-GMP-specific phosphodiesterase class I)